MSRIFYSKPSYTPLAGQPGSPHHLLIADTHGLAHAARLRAQIDAPTTLVLAVTGDAGIQAASDALACPPDDLPDVLAEQLPALPAGTTCYLFGREAFIWPAAVHLRDLGVARGRILAERCGPPVRDVICVHCKQRNIDVPDNMVSCSGCGRLLWNYDHFSRRHGAYMGFQVNAEHPDDIPPREALQS